MLILVLATILPKDKISSTNQILGAKSCIHQVDFFDVVSMDQVLKGIEGTI